MRGRLEGLYKSEAAEADDIHHAIIKPSVDSIAGRMCTLIQVTVEQCQVANDCRVAVVIGIQTGSSAVTENIRPISLTSILRKVTQKSLLGNISR